MRINKKLSFEIIEEKSASGYEIKNIRSHRKQKKNFKKIVLLQYNIFYYFELDLKCNVENNKLYFNTWCLI